MVRVGLARIDDGLKLRVRQERVDVFWQMRPIARHGRRDARHGRGLDELGRMGLSAGNTEDLKAVVFVDRIADVTALGGLPIVGLVVKRFGLRRGGRDRARDPRCPVEIAAHGAGRGRGRRSGRQAGQFDGEPWRNLFGDPAHERSGIRRDARSGLKDRRIVGRQLVDNSEPGVDRRAVLGIDGPVDRCREDDATAFLETGEGRGPDRIVWREAGAGDRHQPAAWRKARERRGDMAERGFGHAALDIRQHGKWRIHEHDGRNHGRIEMIVDLGRVEAGDGQGRKEGREQPGAHLGQLVEDERAAGDLGQNGEEAGPGRGFEHTVGRGDRGGGHCRQAKRDRGRELLEGLRFLGAAGMRRQQQGDSGQQRQAVGRGAGLTQQRLSVFADEQHRRRLARLVCGFPVPCAGRVGGAEGGLHRGAQRDCIDALAAFEMGKQQGRSVEDAGGDIGFGSERERRGGGCRRGCGSHGHGGSLGRAERDRTRMALSLDRTGSNPSRPSSPSQTAIWLA